MASSMTAEMEKVIRERDLAQADVTAMEVEMKSMRLKLDQEVEARFILQDELERIKQERDEAVREWEIARTDLDESNRNNADWEERKNRYKTTGECFCKEELRIALNQINE